jgi:hypothetical protein
MVRATARAGTLLALASRSPALASRSFMPTEAPVRTHCPNCGAKLHRQDLSLCAYCATPLTLGGKIEVAGDETAQRLARLREHAAFATAMAWTPRDPEVELRAENLRAKAWLVLVLSIAALGASTFFNRSIAEVNVLMVAAGLALLASLAMFAWSTAARRRSPALPLLRRPALVVNRRSTTSEKGGIGATIYYFTLHFDDASEGEFRWPGQGTLYEPMPNGTTGLAYTRGERLIEFRKL